MKNKLSLNMLIDCLMLVVVSLTGISGFIVKVVMPCGHDVKHEGARMWTHELLGFDRHQWNDIHLWLGIIMLALFVLHVVLHLKMVVAYFDKKVSNKKLLRLFYFFLTLLIVLTVLPWLYYLFL